MSWVDYASLSVAALAFATSAGFGFLNRRTAKRALAISERQEARRESRLDIYLIDSRAQRRGDKRDRIIGFEVRISNPSDSPNSAVAVELRLTYLIDGTPMAVKLQADRSLQFSTETPGASGLDLPAALESNGARSGWLLYRVDDVLTAPAQIDRYELVVQDVHGIERGLPVTILEQAAP